MEQDEGRVSGAVAGDLPGRGGRASRGHHGRPPGPRARRRRRARARRRAHLPGGPLAQGRGALGEPRRRRKPLPGDGEPLRGHEARRDSSRPPSCSTASMPRWAFWQPCADAPTRLRRLKRQRTGATGARGAQPTRPGNIAPAGHGIGGGRRRASAGRGRRMRIRGGDTQGVRRRRRAAGCGGHGRAGYRPRLHAEAPRHPARSRGAHRRQDRRRRTRRRAPRARRGSRRLEPAACPPDGAPAPKPRGRGSRVRAARVRAAVHQEARGRRFGSWPDPRIRTRSPSRPSPTGCSSDAKQVLLLPCSYLLGVLCRRSCAIWRGTGQRGRPARERRGHRDRSPGPRRAQGPAHPPAAQLRRPRHREAGRAAGAGQARPRVDHDHGADRSRGTGRDRRWPTTAPGSMSARSSRAAVRLGLIGNGRSGRPDRR